MLVVYNHVMVRQPQHLVNAEKNRKLDRTTDSVVCWGPLCFKIILSKSTENRSISVTSDPEASAVVGVSPENSSTLGLILSTIIKVGRILPNCRCMVGASKNALKVGPVPFLIFL